MPYSIITPKQVDAFLSETKLDFINAEGTTDKTKRSYAWHVLTLAQVDKKSFTYKTLKPSVKKLKNVLLFEHASALCNKHSGF